jgi:hypothetical protein
LTLLSVSATIVNVSNEGSPTAASEIPRSRLADLMRVVIDVALRAHDPGQYLRELLPA